MDGETRLWHPHLGMPIRLRKPSRIFVADMGDLFFEEVSDRDIDSVFGVMWACRYLGRGENVYPGHTFQVLTKRAERMRDYLGVPAVELQRRWADAAVREGGGEDPDPLWDSIAFEKSPHPRIWLGVSVEDRKRLDRVDVLRAIPAAARFLSLEPLLEDLGRVDLTGIHQVIVGGESGPGAFPVDPAWVRSLRDQSVAAKVAFFFKQWGGVHKKKNGRELDGRTWSEFPR